MLKDLTPDNYTMLTSDEQNKIFRFINGSGYRLRTRESSSIEFKESFNWGSKDRYGKIICSFANNKGGFIVFGVSDNPRTLVGLNSNNFETLDEAKITEYLNSIFSPEIKFEKNIIKVKSRKIGILRIIESSIKPVIGIKNDGVIKEGEIYYRYNARTDKIKFPELRMILNQIQEKERKQWMDLFEKISRIGPSNAAVLDTLTGRIEGKGGVLIIDKKLIPKLKFINEGIFKESGYPALKLIGDVRPVTMASGKTNAATKFKITDDPSAPVARIAEEDLLKEYSMRYHDIVNALRKKYSNFVQNQKFYTLMRKLKKNKSFCQTRYLDPANPKGAAKDFYNPIILKEFDNHYKLKRKRIKYKRIR